MRQFRTITAMAAVLCAVGTAPALAGEAGGGAAVAGSASPITAYLASLPAGYQDSQLALMTFNTALLSLPGGQRTGYIGSVDNVSARTVTVYWHGTFSQAMIGKLAASSGVHALVASWPYSAAQIATGSRRLLAAASAGAIRGFTVSAVAGFDPAYRGLELEGAYSAGGASAAALTRQTSTLAGIPVRLVPGMGGSPAYGSRDTDYAPFYGGGLMLSPSGNEICSSGFAVRYSGADHITTARHCRPNDFEAANRASSKYGSTKAWANTGQGRLMTASGAGFDFDGAWNSNGYWKGVVGYKDLAVGDNVCTDGGNSGVHCGVKVTKLTVYWNDGYGSEPTIEAYRSAGVAVIQGDSGGPVLVPLSNGTQIYAAGMIQRWAGTNLNPNCGGTWYTGSNACSRTVGFTSMRTVVNSLSGATLVHAGG
jgi:hypothetical protein